MFHKFDDDRIILCLTDDIYFLRCYVSNYVFICLFFFP